MNNHLLSQLGEIIPPDRIRSRYIDLVSFAPDAGFYQLTPKAIVQPKTEAEIVALFDLSRRLNIPLVFRAGGTSLSGQAVTDGILVDLSQYWNRIDIGPKAEFVRMQPGITGGMVNGYLSRHHRKIGPDPSSIQAAMIGGIVSNNASGMCCGVALNAYHTMVHLRFILPDGKTYSTEQPADYERFVTDSSDIASALSAIRRDILANAALHDIIRNKYKTKTTVGYSLNAFIDYEHPLDIMAHLLVGAEGTLAFIAEVVLQTVPEYRHKITGLLYFETIHAACAAVPYLVESGAQMAELMDRASLRAIQDMGGIPAIVKTLPDNAAALLVEYQADEVTTMKQDLDKFLAVAPGLSLLAPPVFSEDAGLREKLWKVRKGLFPAVGAVRASGTTVILEDIAFPLHTLADAVVSLQQLFKKFRYDEAIIFGHAKDGNIHFVITQSFSTPAEVERYSAFIDEMVELVVKKYQGTLKAEHGTGRNMAPFVETEWGPEAYQIIRRIKQVVDPAGLLNPGVIVNDDPKAHVSHLKAMPTVEEEVDRCIECGYCEHKCPSRNLTTSPKRRIVIRRALQNLRAQGDMTQHRILEKQYQYDGIDTCAVDGLCATACPVDIDTGALIKRLRDEQHSKLANALAVQVVRHFGLLVGGARLMLGVGHSINRVFGRRSMLSLTRLFHRIIPAIPLWPSDLQKPPSLRPLRDRATGSAGATRVVYFPACITRMMGSYQGKKKDSIETFLSVCAKAGVTVISGSVVNNQCCSQIFSSKGFSAAYSLAATKVTDMLWTLSEQGSLPIVTDVSSCAYSLQHLSKVLRGEALDKWRQLTFMDSVQFLAEIVVPRVQVKKKKGQIVVHPVCSLHRMNADRQFLDIARHFASEVAVPPSSGCCGMAGDRGFFFPELTASATQAEAAEVRRHSFDGCYSTTKTCELAMTQAVGQQYLSLLYLVDEST